MCAIGFYSVGSTITGVFVVVSADVVVSVVVVVVVAADVVVSAFVVVVSFDESGVVVVSLFPPPVQLTTANASITVTRISAMIFFIYTLSSVPVGFYYLFISTA